MFVSVKREFRDREHDLKLRKIGEEFVVSKERAEKLESLGLVSKIRKPINKEPPEA